MGRVTFESILAQLGRPLPDRESVVLTHAAGWQYPRVTVATEKDLACYARGPREVFVIGGARIYALALPHASRAYITRVHAQPEGDAHFPQLSSVWRMKRTEGPLQGDKDEYPFSYLYFERH